MHQTRGVKWRAVFFAVIVLTLLWSVSGRPGAAARSASAQLPRQKTETIERATQDKKKAPSKPAEDGDKANKLAPVDGSETTGASVIFIHPDGTGVNYWGAARLLAVGPDDALNWDKLPHVAVYKGHIADALAATSNAGGTVHAYGVKVNHDSFGNNSGTPINAADGSARSILHEAKRRGLAVGVISSAAVIDAGTGAFLASVKNRSESAEIARQMLEHAPDVLLGGGEQWFLPKGVTGRHGEGKRDDGRNLIEEARKAGYTVVFTRGELAAIPKTTTKLLGLFAANDTFNDKSEEDLKAAGLPAYQTQAASIAEMVEAAIGVLSKNSKGFMLLAEEEGTDNFAGRNNASGSLEALRRADDAIGVARSFVSRHPKTLLVVAADSDCGGMQVIGETESDMPADKPLPATDRNGSPLDGRDGTSTLPFIAKPDRSGKRLPFAIAWASSDDVMGAVVARAEGFGAETLRGTIDNTGIYRLMYRTLFGRDIP